MPERHAAELPPLPSTKFVAIGTSKANSPRIA